MVLYFLFSLIPLLLLARRHTEFSVLSAYFIINWLAISASVLISSLANAELVELGTTAEANQAAPVFNLFLALFLFSAAHTYRKLRLVCLTSRRHRKPSTEKIEQQLLSGLLVVTLLIAAASLMPAPPLLSGTPVSEYLATLNSVQKFSFVSLSICALPLSSLARQKYLAKEWAGPAATFATLLPGCMWILAGEKMGYLLFILFCAALPWLHRAAVDWKRTKWPLVVAGFVVTSLTLLQYALRDEDPLLMLAARAAMQGQLWYYFYLEAPAIQPIFAGLRFLFGASGVDTLRAMMEIVMPAQLLLEYETAAMTGSHLPSLLHAFGWVLLPVASVIAGVLFGVGTTLLRLAVQAGYSLLSYLIVASFVFPGIEVWVAGNFSRLTTLPPTFFVFTVASLVLLFGRIRIRTAATPSRGSPVRESAYKHRLNQQL
ncbi:hypothetical protein [Piscinibacter gummiphilus]|uniref:Oligosaccharide repeat unit polymerase n=1 Tax=Piscinibacter gummiphilus TaxID=946333 RepID=A0ABZ0CWW6_9BURK|nr:hypothetical protein [Piscinibacter gummiphilus]WOB09452.1 hypothetical protein RXV79_05160 [Piscinibacter gummiphilus]